MTFCEFLYTIDYRYITGPNRLTVRDFWRMIWQEKIGLIVMLANVYEDGKVGTV